MFFCPFIIYLRMTNSYVFYTGIGANKSGKHTKDSFIRIMKAFVRTRDPEYKYNKSKFDKYTLKDWLQYSGAELVRERKTK